MQMNMISGLFAAASLASAVSALGINCRGSGYCDSNGGSIDSLITAVQGIDQSRTYQNGEHIACVDSYTMYGTPSGEGVCAFAQNTGGVPGSSVGALIQALKDHGCGLCGSVPLFFPVNGDNNPDDHGIMTVNYVSNAGSCNGLC